MDVAAEAEEAGPGEIEANDGARSQGEEGAEAGTEQQQLDRNGSRESVVVEEEDEEEEEEEEEEEDNTLVQFLIKGTIQSFSTYYTVQYIMLQIVMIHLL